LTFTYDLDFQSQASYGHDPQIKGQSSVYSKDRVETNGQTDGGTEGRTDGRYRLLYIPG